MDVCGVKPLVTNPNTTARNTGFGLKLAENDLIGWIPVDTGLERRTKFTQISFAMQPVESRSGEKEAARIKSTAVKMGVRNKPESVRFLRNSQTASIGLRVGFVLSLAIVVFRTDFWRFRQTFIAGMRDGVRIDTPSVLSSVAISPRDRSGRTRESRRAQDRGIAGASLPGGQFFG